MADGPNSGNLVFGADAPTCSRTGRKFELGHGALPFEQQTENYVREAAIAADMPKPGEVCVQTGRVFESGFGCHTKSTQTKRFLSELPEPEQRRRAANAAALAAASPAGSA